MQRSLPSSGPLDGEQRCRDRPLLGQQNVVGRHGAAGCDGFDDHLAVAKSLANLWIKRGNVRSKTDEQDVDVIGDGRAPALATPA